MPAPHSHFKAKAGRGERIRTSGPYVPNVVLYQAELLPDGQQGQTGRISPGQAAGLYALRAGISIAHALSDAYKHFFLLLYPH